VETKEEQGGLFSQSLRWETAHVSVPPIFGKHVMHTDENKINTLCTPYTLWGFANAFQAKYVANDEMIKNRNFF